MPWTDPLVARRPGAADRSWVKTLGLHRLLLKCGTQVDLRQRLRPVEIRLLSRESRFAASIYHSYSSVSAKRVWLLDTSWVTPYIEQEVVVPLAIRIANGTLEIVSICHDDAMLQAPTSGSVSNVPNWDSTTDRYQQERRRIQRLGLGMGAGAPPRASTGRTCKTLGSGAFRSSCHAGASFTARMPGPAASRLMDLRDGHASKLIPGASSSSKSGRSSWVWSGLPTPRGPS